MSISRNRTHPATTLPLHLSGRSRRWIAAMMVGCVVAGSCSGTSEGSAGSAQSSSVDGGTVDGAAVDGGTVDGGAVDGEAVDGADESGGEADDVAPAEAGMVVDGTVEVGGGSIVMVDAVPAEPADAAAITVLFLHGAAYTSQTWVANGILSATAVGGYRSIAIDLPGYGNSDSVDVDEQDFLGELLTALGLDPAATVIVSPSMSGIYSLSGLRTESLADLAGYVPVAPSGASSFADDGPVVDVPALVIWGDGDGGDPAASAGRLAEGFATAEVLILAEAGHAAYEQQPEAFTAALLNFVATL